MLVVHFFLWPKKIQLYDYPTFVDPFLTLDCFHPMQLQMILILLHSYVKDSDNLCIYCEMLFLHLDELFFFKRLNIWDF